MAVAAPFIMMGMAVMSAAMSAVSMIQQGQAAKAAADANARMLRDRAEQQRRLGEMAKRQTDIEGAALMGRQRAQLAARGFSLDDGTPVELLAHTAQQIEWKGELQQWQHEAGATGSENQARLETFRGDQAATAGWMGAAGAVLGGAGRAFSMFGGGGPGSAFQTTGNFAGARSGYPEIA